ncbi:hypothetical protein [Lactococcus petauri]|uniref:hypothetical protein n=1 Tax=Lactococcus petauri TaxID=1940789 RepID=UPI0013FD9B59|nr:hypothetical protein [Lactococcus petauri]NHI76621.1 hypothetical protein [Lactococcus petauri]
MKDRTKKLIKIGGLAAALALIGGTFAFTNFGQRVLNITEDTNRPDHGARVHDYFQDDETTANKDVFVENFGTEPVFARVKLTELFMRNGLPLDENGNVINEESTTDVDPEDPDTWPVFIPAYDEQEGDPYQFRAAGYRDNGSASLNFLNQYFHLQLGQATHGEDRPWYMPTFNFHLGSVETAAAGRAIDGQAEGVTHPGDGTDGYWGEGDTAFALPEFTAIEVPETQRHSTEEHTAAQVLEQERAPIPFEQWELLNAEEQVGNYWIFDRTTGWAYWADLLEGATPGSAAGGQATSFLVDNKLRQEAGLESIRMDWSYKLHVIGGFAEATANAIDQFSYVDAPGGNGDLPIMNMGTILSTILHSHGLPT